MNYQVTGNEYISLPTLRESDGAAEGVTFLYMQVKGLLELRGKAGLIRPYMEAEEQRLRCIQSGRGSIAGFPALRRRSGRFAFRAFI